MDNLHTAKQSILCWTFEDYGPLIMGNNILTIILFTSYSKIQFYYLRSRRNKTLYFETVLFYFILVCNFYGKSFTVNEHVMECVMAHCAIR